MATKKKAKKKASAKRGAKKSAGAKKTKKAAAQRGATTKKKAAAKRGATKKKKASAKRGATKKKAAAKRGATKTKASAKRGAKKAGARRRTGTRASGGDEIRALSPARTVLKVGIEREDGFVYFIDPADMNIWRFPESVEDDVGMEEERELVFETGLPVDPAYAEERVLYYVDADGNVARTEVLRGAA